AGAVQDDRRAGPGRLTPDIEHEVRVAVGTELPAEDVDAAVAARRRRGARAERPGRSQPAGQSQRACGGQYLALDGHSWFLLETCGGAPCTATEPGHDQDRGGCSDRSLIRRAP